MALALLLSNIVGLSCAMAHAVCADCPQHPPVICKQPCAAMFSVVGDKAPDGLAGFNPPAAYARVMNMMHPDAGSVSAIDSAGHAPIDGQAPELNLRFCVFLK